MIEDPKNFGILTDSIEKEKRLFLCNSCEEKVIMNDISTCNKCVCPIDYVITYKFKICPLEKWRI